MAPIRGEDGDEVDSIFDDADDQPFGDARDSPLGDARGPTFIRWVIHLPHVGETLLAPE